MKLLLDTHLLLWAAGQPERLSKEARKLLRSPENELYLIFARGAVSSATMIRRQFLKFRSQDGNASTT